MVRKCTWVLGLVAVSAVAIAVLPIAGAGITGSAHDFSSDSWSGGEICAPCHTPHNADISADAAGAPLWNHEVTSTTFTLYSSGTLDASVGQPAGASKLCLSCHDGSVALDSFGGATGTTNISGSADLGTDLNAHHPISFTYNTALATADGELEDPSTANSGLGSTIDADLLFSGSLECASCHDVHDTVSTGNENLLVIDNAGSALCLTCHQK